MDASGGYTPQNLSPRQHDVFVRGLSNKEIARSLNVAEGTVKIHVAALFGKLGVHRRAAVAIAGGHIGALLQNERLLGVRKPRCLHRSPLLPARESMRKTLAKARSDALRCEKC